MTDNTHMGQPQSAESIVENSTRPVDIQTNLDRSYSAGSGSLGRARWLMLGLLMVAGLLWLGEDARPAVAQGVVSVEKIVSTSNDDPNTAFNGDTIAYTIIVNNGTANTLSDILILDVLPENVLDNIQCLDAPSAVPCELINEIEQIPEPLGGTLTVTTTRQISWAISNLPPNGTLTRSFTARVIGQADGAAFTNVAYASYEEQNLLKTQASNEVRLNVRLRIEQGGSTTLSDTPTWFSEDVGGTLSSDWADFDGDGDLDMVLGSTLGTTVYRNNIGQLEQFWTSNTPAYGVRWGDVTGDGRPELIAVGAVENSDGETGNPAQLPGVNYVYLYDSTTGATTRRFVPLSTFASDVQMVRVEAADFDNDGFVDLIASTNAINPTCAVQLFPNDGTGVFTESTCISRAATAALRPIDFDNDGDQDLVMGLFPNRVQILKNVNGVFSVQNTVSIEEGVMFLPYDFAWGDFDRDGFLDLAAAFPLMREVRIYRNLTASNPNGAFARPISLRTNVFLTPYALDWGDFSGDGRLDLAVADSPPIIYTYSSGYTSSSFRPFFTLEDNVVRGQVWSLRAIDQNNDGDIDMTLTDRDGPSLVISNFRPPLAISLTPVAGVAPFNTSSPASSVAWIDADGDGDLDLMFGAGPATVGAAALNTKLYFNEEGLFPPEAARAYSGFGPHALAVGDADGDSDLDIAIGSASEQRLHRSGEFLAPFWSIGEIGDKALAWGDADGDVDLDLLVSTTNADTGRLELYLNDGAGNMGTFPAWGISITGIHAIAWGDMDGDGFLDIAVGKDGQNVIYRNNRDTTFSLFWTAEDSYHTRAIAWADYDGDGDLDLSVGNFGLSGGAGEANLLYENIEISTGRSFVARPALGTDAFHTTSMDWGDWDNDGDLDLAVGNYGAKVQIYVNSNSSPGLPQFFWLWSSDETLNTTGVAWGDKDNDGDLDLAVSQDGARLNGIYTNNLVVPSHLPNSGFGVATLINPPLYIHIGRPGATASAYNFSSAEILSGPGTGPLPISFRLYNPTNSPAVGTQAFSEESLSTVAYEYSLDGGGVWKTATPVTYTLAPITDELGSGIQGTFIWNTVRDQAIGDNARFRVRVVQADSSGPVQRVTAASSSPPFRVRAITCIWPEQPEVRPSSVLATGGEDDNFDYQVAANTAIRFTGKVAAGTGALYYTWNFGNGSAASGQVVEQQFSNGYYQVRMAVSGEPCPQTRERAATLILKVGTGSPNLHMPALFGNALITDTPSVAVTQVVTTQTQPEIVAAPLAQVDALKGNIQVDNGALWLRWSAYTASADRLLLYHSDSDADTLEATRELVAELPLDTTAYQDDAPLCGQNYFLVAVADGRESLPSTSSYYTAPCSAD